MAFTETMSALTRDKFMPILVDNIFNSNALCLKLLKNADKLDGGAKIIVPIEFAKNNNSGFISYDGADGGTVSAPTTQLVSDIAKKSEWNWSTACNSIVIEGQEGKMNSGANAVLSV